MLIRFSALALLLVGLAACDAPAPQAEVDPLTAALTGKSLVIGDDVFNVNADGTLIGVGGPNQTRFVGTWEIVNGQWCREFTEPEAFAGRACQKAVLGDGTVTITGERGPRTWSIQ